MAEIETLSDALRTAPLAVRTFLESGAFAEAMERAQQATGLGEDIVERAGREVLFVLVGLADSAGLAETLEQEAGMPQASLAPFLEVVHEQIYAPIQKELEKGVQAASPVATPAPVVAPARVQAVNPPAPKPASPSSYTADPYREPIE